MIEKIEIPITDEWREMLNLPDDYKQYYYTDFITGKEYCYLHDGTYADIYKYSYSNDKTKEDDPDFEQHQMEFLVLTLKMRECNRDKIEEGEKYAKEHGVKREKWIEEAEEQWNELINSDDDSNDEPTDSNSSNQYPMKITTIIPLEQPNEKIVNIIYDCIEKAVSIDNDLNQDNVNKWHVYNDGWTHEHVIATERRTWLLGDEESNPEVMFTAGVYNDKIVLKIRFITADGEIVDDSYPDVDMKYDYKHEPLLDDNITNTEFTESFINDFSELVNNMRTTAEKKE